MTQPAAAETTNPLRIFHCDDSTEFLKLTHYWLLEHDDLVRVGTATTRATALARIPNARPDVILLDTLGADAITVDDLRAIVPSASIIVYTGYDDQAATQVIPDADAYLQKRDDEHELLAAVRRLPRRRC